MGPSVGPKIHQTRNIKPADPNDPESYGKTWASSVEDPWDACILTLDGGGIRGYSSLLILRELFHQIHKWEQRLEQDEPLSDSQGASLPSENDLLPCHYFDLMYGTSTGGLIAVMLGRLRMSIGECLEKYREVGDKLFGHRKSSIPLRTKYRHEPLEKAVRDIVGDRNLGEMHPWEQSGDPTQWDPEAPHVCQSCCLTAVHSTGPDAAIKAHLLRSYHHYYSDDPHLTFVTRYNEGADPLLIWQVTRATSAAPFYFNALQAIVGDELRTYKDGGTRENNPTGAAYSEFRSLYRHKKSPALLLSVGTGRADQSQDGFFTTFPFPYVPTSFRALFAGLEKFSVMGPLLIKLTDSERQHLDMRVHASGENTWYKRLNVSTGLERMHLDSWVRGPYRVSSQVQPGSKPQPEPGTVPGGQTLAEMEAATNAYMAREFDPRFDHYAQPAVMLDQMAEKLVRQRRARVKIGGPRWETFVGMHLPATQAII